MELLIISFSPLHRDPRVYRQLKFFKDESELNLNITAAGYTDPDLRWVKYVKVKSYSPNILEKIFYGVKLKLKRFEGFYWNDESVKDAMRSLKGRHFDIIIANDINTLPLAIILSKDTGAKVMIDCHEYSPREFEGNFKFSFFFEEYYDYICKTYIPITDIRTTVCQNIADEYKNKCGGEWHVITNAPFYEDLRPSIINKDDIRIIHHGNLIASRNVETMIKLVDLLESRFHLDFMFVNNNPSYYEKLLNKAKDKRIHFRNPVPMTEVSSTLNDYDIGLYMLSPVGFNNQMSLPNKFFEFIQARLALAIWPSPEMAKITNEYNCGVVSDDFSVESIAKALNVLSSEDIMHYKMKSDNAAVSLCAEKNGEILTSLISTLLS